MKFTKQITFILTLSLSISLAFSQSKETNAKIVDYYGIDFSLAKIQGARELPYKFKQAYYGINYLILKEYPKYNIAKYLGKDEVVPNIEIVSVNNAAVDLDKIFIWKSKYEIADAQLDSLVKTYKIPASKNEIGVVIVGELLSKELLLGTFRVVYFENATKIILSSKVISGKPSGAGVRNFWAGSLLNGLKDYKE